MLAKTLTSINSRASHLMGCDGGLPSQTSWVLAEGWRRARRGLHTHFHEAAASGSGAVVPREQEVPLPQSS